MGFTKVILRIRKNLKICNISYYNFSFIETYKILNYHSAGSVWDQYLKVLIALRVLLIREKFGAAGDLRVKMRLKEAQNVSVLTVSNGEKKNL